MTDTARLPSEMAAVVRKLKWPPLQRDHNVTANSRVVHDLGIVGDDWDEFYEELCREYKCEFSIEDGYIPGEISHDSAMVAHAGGWLARKLPKLQGWYISRIRCRPLTLGDLHDFIIQSMAVSSSLPMRPLTE